MSRLLTTETKIANMFYFKLEKKKINSVFLKIHLLKLQVLLEMVLLFESGFMNNKTYPLDSHS